VPIAIKRPRGCRHQRGRPQHLDRVFDGPMRPPELWLRSSQKFEGQVVTEWPKLQNASMTEDCVRLVASLTRTKQHEKG
jgi:hypothetical protein